MYANLRVTIVPEAGLWSDGETVMAFDVRVIGQKAHIELDGGEDRLEAIGKREVDLSTHAIRVVADY